MDTQYPARPLVYICDGSTNLQGIPLTFAKIDLAPLVHKPYWTAEEQILFRLTLNHVNGLCVNAPFV